MTHIRLTGYPMTRPRLNGLGRYPYATGIPLKEGHCEENMVDFSVRKSKMERNRQIINENFNELAGSFGELDGDVDELKDMMKELIGEIQELREEHDRTRGFAVDNDELINVVFDSLPDKFYESIEWRKALMPSSQWIEREDYLKTYFSRLESRLDRLGKIVEAIAPDIVEKVDEDRLNAWKASKKEESDE